MIRSAVLSVIGIEAITQVDAGRVSIGTFSIAGTAFVVDALGVSRGACIEHVLGSWCTQPRPGGRGRLCRQLIRSSRSLLSAPSD
jgi:hypothetical protein